MTDHLAFILHEAGREAVLANKVHKKDGAPLGAIKFAEWNEITEDAKEGRRIQARFLDRLFRLVPRPTFPASPVVAGQAVNGEIKCSGPMCKNLARWTIGTSLLLCHEHFHELAGQANVVIEGMAAGNRPVDKYFNKFHEMLKHG